jgi:hypothetical protein
MNRREAIAAGATLVFSLKSPAGPPVKKKEPPCPCVDKDAKAKNPLERKHAHICAFHVGYDDPKLQMEVTHYCTAVGDGVFQCILYESPEKDAKLIGVEYVITEKRWGQLPLDEAKLWHPHRWEIEDGLLTIHNVTKSCEAILLKALYSSWGKTWHTWPDPSTEVPLGKPILMWSAGGPNGVVDPKLVAKRDAKYKLNVEEVKKTRAKLFGK